MAKEKSRNFTFLLYPDGEGFPSDWEERLEKSECRLQLVRFMIKIRIRIGHLKTSLSWYLYCK